MKTTSGPCSPSPRCPLRHAFDALKDIGGRLPFSLPGIDSDNGSEFINGHLFRYCQEEKITFTRTRGYRKNEQFRDGPSEFRGLRQSRLLDLTASKKIRYRKGDDFVYNFHEATGGYLFSFSSLKKRSMEKRTPLVNKGPNQRLFNRVEKRHPLKFSFNLDVHRKNDYNFNVYNIHRRCTHEYLSEGHPCYRRRSAHNRHMVNP